MRSSDLLAGEQDVAAVEQLPPAEVVLLLMTFVVR